MKNIHKEQLVFETIFRRGPITQTAVAQLHGLATRTIRRYVRDLRLAGQPIASGNEGYWYAVEKTELNHTINKLYSQNKSHIDLILAMERNM